MQWRGPAARPSTSPPTTVVAEVDCGRLQPAPGPAAGWPAPSGPPAVTLTGLGVALAQPTAVVGVPGSDDLFVAERAGTVRRLVPDGIGFRPVSDPALDLRADVGPAEGERGLLGLAVSPEGERLYIDRTDAVAGDLVVEAVDLVDGVPVAATRTVLLQVESPCGAHYGGGLVVDDRGDLLIGLGNGGGVADPADRGRDPHDLFGSILRITPTPGDERPYAIPEDNPFADGSDGAAEVLVVGLRYPWRFDLDDRTGDPWVADVGEDSVEELTRLQQDEIGGADLGWDLREGTRPFEEADEAPDDLVDPQYEYTHDEGCSIMGGVVVADPALPALRGAYLLGDLCSGVLHAARPGPDGSVDVVDLGVSVPGVVSFGHDRSGRVYVVSLGGAILRIDPAA